MSENQHNLLTKVTRKGQRPPPELRVPAKIAFHLFNDKKLKEKLKDVNLPTTGKRKVSHTDTADEAVSALAVKHRRFESHCTRGVACITLRRPPRSQSNPLLCYITLSLHAWHRIGLKFSVICSALLSAARILLARPCTAVSAAQTCQLV